MHQSVSHPFLVHESADEYHAHARHHLSSHQLADFRKCPQLFQLLNLKSNCLAAAMLSQAKSIKRMDFPC